MESDESSFAMGAVNSRGFELAVATGRVRRVLVLVEPLGEDVGGGLEVVAEGDQEIDVVVVSLAAEAMGEIVARVDGGAQLAAVGTEEAEVTFEVLGGWRLVAETPEGDFHRQRIANGPQKLFGDHGQFLCPSPLAPLPRRGEGNVAVRSP